MVDDIFAGLYFERMKMPTELTSPGRPVQNDKDKPKEKKSVGNFIIEGVIELFETCLSYLTNTMSFLRDCTDTRKRFRNRYGGIPCRHSGIKT